VAGGGEECPEAVAEVLPTRVIPPHAHRVDGDDACKFANAKPRERTSYADETVHRAHVRARARDPSHPEGMNRANPSSEQTCWRGVAVPALTRAGEVARNAKHAVPNIASGGGDLPELVDELERAQVECANLA
jgi:hypothetical protein